MADKEHFTAAQMIEAAKGSRGIVVAAARTLGCDRATVEQYKNRYPSVAAAFRQERETLIDLGEAALVKAVNSEEAWAIMFLLRNLGRDRGYADKQVQEHIGEVTLRVVHVDDSNKS